MRLILPTLLVLTFIGAPANATSLLDTLQNKVMENLSGAETTSGSSDLSQQQIVNGLREALKVASQRVVNQVGSKNGYLKDPAIHIPLPDQLKTVQDLLGKVGLSSLADTVETRLNRAAEQAAPKAKPIIWDAITNMSLQDARDIYQGPNDAATQYFKRVSSTQLREMISPIAKDSLKDVGALQAYDQLMGEYQSLPFVPDVKADLVSHTTELAMQGIFHYLAQEEAAIRQDPAKRTTEILKTVFGS